MVNLAGEELTGGELEKRFQLLEEKVLQAVEKIRLLESERTERQAELDALNERVKDLQKQLETAQEKALEAESWKAQVQELTRMKHRVAEKIEDLVRKIETLPFLQQP